MGFYDEKKYFQTLKWDDVFTGPDEFYEKIGSIASITEEDDLKHLYDLLVMKYHSSYTRYTNELSFILAIKRELHVEFPIYLMRKELLDDMFKLEVEEIQRGSRVLRNLVETHDDPVVNAHKNPIEDLSTEQEYLTTINNELEAMKAKYNAIGKNYLAPIYKACDELFKVILAEDIYYLYKND